mmetsp:Transcript_33214/g.86973  ORF Transcript_33214/g.86973 Transcript_33214/m.86973 type:complete len:289 (-) Transcript_33214:475-1341(-)
MHQCGTSTRRASRSAQSAACVLSCAEHSAFRAWRQMWSRGTHVSRSTIRFARGRPPRSQRTHRRLWHLRMSRRTHRHSDRQPLLQDSQLPPRPLCPRLRHPRQDPPKGRQRAVPCRLGRILKVAQTSLSLTSRAAILRSPQRVSGRVNYARQQRQQPLRRQCPPFRRLPHRLLGLQLRHQSRRRRNQQLHQPLRRLPRLPPAHLHIQQPCRPLSQRQHQARPQVPRQALFPLHHPRQCHRLLLRQPLHIPPVRSRQQPRQRLRVSCPRRCLLPLLPVPRQSILQLFLR